MINRKITELSKRKLVFMFSIDPPCNIKEIFPCGKKYIVLQMRAHADTPTFDVQYKQTYIQTMHRLFLSSYTF